MGRKRKSILSVILSILLLSQCFVGIFPLAASAAEPTNVALNKSVTVSGTADNCPGPNAVDGRTNTRWSSNYVTNGWIYVDLGSQMRISSLRLIWEAAYGKAYDIQIADNSSGPWTTIYSQTNGFGGTETIELPASVYARYVRMQGVTRALPSYGFSLWEFEVYGVEPSEFDLNFGPIGNQTAFAGVPFSVTLTTTGYIGDGVTFSAFSGMPEGAILNSQTGEFTWTPTKDQFGSYTILFRATNGMDTVQKDVTISVGYDLEKDLTAPSWPENSSLIISNVDSTRVTLDWPHAQDTETGVEFYDIFNGTEKILTIPGNNNRQTIKGLASGIDYNFSVLARDYAGHESPALAGSMKTLATSAFPLRKNFSETYPTEYSEWMNALMAGNGKMGVMVFGNPLKETIIYNDRGFNNAPTTSRPSRTFNTMTPENLQQIKDYLVVENWREANRLANTLVGWQDGGEGNRHPGFKMNINTISQGTMANFYRMTDLSTGEVIVNWRDDLGDWQRKTFVSRKDNVTVQYLTAPTNGKVNCTIQLASDSGMGTTNFTFNSIVSDNFLNMRVNYPSNTNGAGYEGVTRVIVNGGTKTIAGSAMTITDADSVLMLTRTEKYKTGAAAEFAKQLIQTDLAALPTDYEVLLKGQLETHGEIFDRVQLDLGASESDRMLTNEELVQKQIASTTMVPALYERLFDAGRFHYLCSSFEKAAPDLLGVWTGDIRVGWQGFYHLDANLNLQISSGNIGNMAEAMEGYYYLNEKWQDGFRENASKLLGTRGMVGGGNTPGEASGLISSIGGNATAFYPYQYVTGEMGWLLYPFWEHYQISGDVEFLRDRLYPLIRDMGDFYEDFLTETDENGKFIFAGSISPETQPSGIGFSLVNNSTFDIAGAKFSLETLIKVCKLIGTDQTVDKENIVKWQAILDKIPPYLINSHGALAEWSWPSLINANTYGHRHASHLITVWPLREISPEKTPDLFKNASEALRRKEISGAANESAGHGILHTALIAANTNNPVMVANKLMRVAKERYYFDGLATSHDRNYSTFCTDTANTVPGIMMEMLINSDDGVIELLPALPESLKTGSVSGLKNRNRTTTEKLSWNLDQGEIDLIITSDIDQDLIVIERAGIENIQSFPADTVIKDSDFGDIAKVVSLKAGVPTTLGIELFLDKEPEPAPDPDTNIALNKPAASFSQSNDQQGPEKAFDGSMSTRWSSNQNNADWLQVDLGAKYDLSKVVIKWEDSFGSAYKIQVSDNGTTWADVYEISGNTALTNEIALTNASGRFVRMQGVARATQWGYSIWEMEVYGSIARVSTPTASPEEGNYDGAQFVTLNSATEGASIYYTLNGGTPSIRSNLYTTPILVDKDMTIRAIAVKEDMPNSVIANFTYAIKGAPQPSLTQINAGISSLAANCNAIIKADVSGALLDGASIVLKFVNRNGIVIATSEPVAAINNAAVIRLDLTAAHTTIAGNYSLIAQIVDTDVAVSASITVEAWSNDIWKFTATDGEYNGKSALKAVFYGDIARTISGTVKVGNIVSKDVVTIGNVLFVADINADTLAEGTNVVISGVKYPTLFPSYSFTFTGIYEISEPIAPIQYYSAQLATLGGLATGGNNSNSPSGYVLENLNNANSWAQWTIPAADVSKSGTYTLGVYYATNDAGPSCDVIVNNSALSDRLAMPGSGGWNNFTGYAEKTVPLIGGQDNIIRLSIGASSGQGFNVYQISIVQSN